MSKWRVTLADTTNGEVYSIEEDGYSFPTHLSDPYSGNDRDGLYRTGIILRVEKILYESRTI